MKRRRTAAQTLALVALERLPRRQRMAVLREVLRLEVRRATRESLRRSRKEQSIVELLGDANADEVDFDPFTAVITCKPAEL